MVLTWCGNFRKPTSLLLKGESYLFLKTQKISIFPAPREKYEKGHQVTFLISNMCGVDCEEDSRLLTTPIRYLAHVQWGKKEAGGLKRPLIYQQ